MICPETAHYGLLSVLKHVKNSGSGDTGWLPADPEANSILSLKENERITG